MVLPLGDPALVGEVNRALAARGVRWHFGPPGPPGTLASADLAMVRGVQVNRRYRLEGTEGDSGVVASVNGEPWLVRDGGVVLLGSRLDTTRAAPPGAPRRAGPVGSRRPPGGPKRDRPHASHGP